jgi:hypothetical protein
MKCKMIFGALLVSVVLCNQGFSFELLDRILGLNGGDCGDCKACAKVACCEKPAKCCAAPAVCEKAKPACCEKAKPACCEKPVVCGTPKCHKQHCTPIRDLFDDIADLFESKGYICDEPKTCAAPKACCSEPACCKPACKVKACEKVACCKPATCEKVACCKPATCEKVACCKPATCEKVCQPKCHKLYRRPVVELLEDIFGSISPCKSQEGCETACGGAAPAQKAPATAPAKAPEHAAPLPAAPKADPSASLDDSRGIYQASRSLVRN